MSPHMQDVIQTPFFMCADASPSLIRSLSLMLLQLMLAGER
jgi:hypothetical protein